MPFPSLYIPSWTRRYTLAAKHRSVARASHNTLRQKARRVNAPFPSLYSPFRMPSREFLSYLILSYHSNEFKDTVAGREFLSYECIPSWMHGYTLA